MNKNLNKFYLEMAYLHSETKMFGINTLNAHVKLKKFLDVIIGTNISLPEDYRKLINGLIYLYGCRRVLVQDKHKQWCLKLYLN